MKKIAFITPGDAEYGFSLAGAVQRIAREGELKETVSRLLAESDIGILVIDERLLAGLPTEELRAMERSWHGIFVVLPAPEAPGAGVEDFATALIRKAVGYHLRLGA